jgi:hypothetical protein
MRESVIESALGLRYPRVASGLFGLQGTLSK